MEKERKEKERKEKEHKKKDSLVAFHENSYMMQVADDLKNHHAAVMVGAGFSKNANAVLPAQKPMMDWSELADQFYRKLYRCSARDAENGGFSCLNPLDLAEEVEAEFGRPVLDQMLQEAIPDMNYQPSGLHQKLLKLPWSDIFTTNYDTLLERAAEQVESKRFNVIYVKEDLVNSADAPRIVKLHGSFPSHRPFIITREDYRRYPRSFAPFVNMVQQALLENTLCLIGFSGDDPNFQSWIGWIHDNLGKENSPQIYLVTYGASRSGRLKLLQNKRIAEIDIRSLVPGGSYRECLEAFLDGLADACRQKEDFMEWPGRELFSAGEEPEPEKLTEILRRCHESYPGWMVAPEGIRLNAEACLIHIETQFYQLKEARKKGELSFLYEYNWMKERTLLLLTESDISIYEKVLGRNPEETEERLELQLALLRAYRENGMQKKWTELLAILEQNTEELSLEQRHRMAYEKGLYLAAEADMEQLGRLLKRWNVTAQEPVWCLRKAGLWVLTGEWEKAEELLLAALFLVRRQLQKTPRNILFLSVESALAVLSGYIRQVRHYQSWEAGEGSGDEGQERRDGPDLESSHATYQTAWERMEDCLVTAIRSENSAPDGRRRSFDLNRITYTTHFGADRKLRAALEYLRFREETGIPFRIANVHSGREAALEAACRICGFQLERGISLLVLCACDKDEIMDRVVGRVMLQDLSADECDRLGERYLKQLRSIAPYLDDMSGFRERTLAAFAARTLPGILSRFCCKCHAEVLDCQGEVIAEIYKSAYIRCYSQMDAWMRRWVSAYSRKEQQERIERFLSIPVLPTDHRFLSYPDPVGYLAFQREKDYAVTISDYACSQLCDQAGQEKYKTAVMHRFVSLNDRGYLTPEQRDRILPLLWSPQDSLGRYPQIVPLAYVEWMPDNKAVLEMWKKDIKDRLAAEASDKALCLNVQGTILAELLSSLEKRLWAEEEWADILRSLLPIYKKNVEKARDGLSFLSLDAEIEMVVRRINRLLAASLYYCPNLAFTEKMLEQMRGDHTLSAEAGIILRKKEGGDFDAAVLLEEKILGGETAERENIYQTLLDLVGDRFGTWISIDEKKELIQMLAQQIMWRKDNGLKDALDTMSLIIRENPLMEEEGVWQADIRGMLSRGLGFLAKDTAVFRETETEVLHCLDLRASSAKLAGALYAACSAASQPIPENVLKWEQIGTDRNEIVDVRSAWEEFCGGTGFGGKNRSAVPVAAPVPNK